MKKAISGFSLGRIALLLCSAAALLLTGCLDTDLDDNPAPTAVAYVSFYHGSPDAPDLDVLLDGKRINEQAFKYSHASNYIAVTKGSHKVAFTPVTEASVLVDTTFSFQENKIYSLYTVNRVQDMGILAVEDSLIVPGSGKAGVRLINLSPDASAVDVTVAGDGASPLFTNLDFKGSTQFTRITDGTHTFQVREAGTENVLVPATSLTLEPGRNYTLIVRGFKTPPAGNTSVPALQIVRNY